MYLIMTFKKHYFLIFIVLLLIEACIAYFLKSGFIRHTLGDFLVVILLYCFIRSFLKITPFQTSMIVLIIAFTIEILQLTPLLEFLNLENNKTAKLILGSTFHVNDLVAYAIGVLLTFWIDSLLTTKAETEY